MKKTALTFLLAAIATAAAHAQTAYDAWLFSENNYEGTARSVAMGNAFTALGGDLGAVSINPAGSAVAGYSQFSITPSLTFSVNTATGVPYEGSHEPYFQKTTKSRMTRAGIPNIGLTLNFDTGRKSGLKSITAGFIMNRTNSWSEDVYARGTNSTTSFLAAAAADATDELIYMNQNKAPGEADFTADDYDAENAYDYMRWTDVVCYRGGMFAPFGEGKMNLAGATETVLENGQLMQSGTVGQTYGRSVYGNKYEYLINVGANISDFVYIGVNLGINSLNYDYTHYFKESAVDPYDFGVIFTDNNSNEASETYFNHAKYKYSYSATGTGVFGKLGIIVTPGGGFRIGAAIQTPTANTMKEQWQESAETTFADSKFDRKAQSPLGDYQYRFNSPFRANFGVAYTLGKFAVFSADYEITDFGSMRYKYDRHDMPEDDVAYMDRINEEIRSTYGVAHYLRIGAEVKPVSMLAIRAGYNLGSSAQKKFLDAGSGDYLDLEPTYAQNISFGLGYNSKKSFFADIACRHTFRTDEFIYPYSDYLADHGILSPEILNRHSNWKVLLTLGWRF